MKHLAKFFQYAYLVIAILFIQRGIAEWNTNRGNAYLMFFLSVVAIFVFFFRRHFRNKYKDRNS